MSCPSQCPTNSRLQELASGVLVPPLPEAQQEKFPYPLVLRAGNKLVAGAETSPSGQGDMSDVGKGQWATRQRLGHVVQWVRHMFCMYQGLHVDSDTHIKSQAWLHLSLWFEGVRTGQPQSSVHS